MNIVQWFKRVEMKVLKALSNRAEMYETIKIHVFCNTFKINSFFMLKLYKSQIALKCLG